MLPNPLTKWVWQSFTHQFWSFLGFRISPNGKRIDPPLFAKALKWVWQSFTDQFWGFLGFRVLPNGNRLDPSKWV